MSFMLLAVVPVFGHVLPVKAGLCSRRTWCLLEPILPKPRLRLQPKQELSDVVKALVQSKCAKVGLWGGKKKKKEERPFINSAI